MKAVVVFEDGLTEDRIVSLLMDVPGAMSARMLVGGGDTQKKTAQQDTEFEKAMASVKDDPFWPIVEPMVRTAWDIAQRVNTDAVLLKRIARELDKLGGITEKTQRQIYAWADKHAAQNKS